MSELKPPYILNHNYQQWVLDQDEVEDLEYTPCTDHRHDWHLAVDAVLVGDDLMENVITAWCQCGEALSQDAIIYILNRSAQP